MLKGLNLYLIGMMGVGKSTIGHLLAKELHYRFFDTDNLIQDVTQKDINTIFNSAGESTFRQIESQVLAQLSAYTYLVVATGGGIILKRENWSYLHHGFIVWLDAPVELLIARLQNDSTRPLLKDPDPAGKLQTLLAERQPLYAQADLRIPVSEGETPEEIAQRIITEIPTRLKPVG